MDAPDLGHLDDGTAVHTYRIGAGGLALQLIDLGATVQRLEVPDRDGAARNVVLGHRELAAYASSSSYFGSVVGRFANRIAGGRFRLDGREYALTTNEGGNTLHGGVDGFDRRVWTVSDLAEDEVTFGLVSPDGDQGFPGELAASVRYAVSPGEVRLDYRATTDAPTVLNLTNHTYFNLEGEGAWTVDGHLLTIEADRFVPVDESSLPTGGTAPVVGTALDWRTAQRVGDRVRIPDGQLLLSGGLDHHLVVRGEGLRPQATLTAPATGIAVTVLSDQPGIQAYTGNYLDGHVVGTSGRTYRQGAGIALETQHVPDSPNHPEFPSTVLRPGETFTSTTIWRFTAS